MSIFPVYANMYVLLVGSPGSKKSTGMKFAEKLVEKLKDIPYAPASVTKEALTAQMGKADDSPYQKRMMVDGKLEVYTHVSFFCNEFVTLLEAGNNAQNMITFLTEIWDRDSFRVETKNQGIDDIPRPYVTVLGCLTSESMSNLAAQKIITSGFSRRCVFVYTNEYAEPVPLPVITPEQTAARERLLLRAREIQKLKGKYVLTDESKAWWDAWYRKNHADLVNEKDAIRQAWLQSKPGYVIKLAMLHRMSSSDELILTPDEMTKALHDLVEVETNMMQVFEGTGRNDKAPVAAEIRRYIESAGKDVLVKDILKTFYKRADNEEIKKILDHLHQIGEIERSSITVGSLLVPTVKSKKLAS